MLKQPPAAARAVVIGGGVVGCSVAYHLAKSGVEDVVVIERAQLGSGTTWHSVGNMETYRADPVMFEIVKYGLALFPQLELESEQCVGWKTRGRVMFTHRKDRHDAYKTVPRLANRQGIDISYIDRETLGEYLPILDTSEILGGLWIPGDGSVNPTDLTMAFARAARRFGATIVEECPATKILSDGNRITGVATDNGDVECEHIVVAAGMWSNEITATCGIRLPLIAAEHFYLMTDVIPDLPENLPMFFGFDDYLYGREEVGGLIVGALDKGAIPIDTGDLPKDFAFGLLNERWDQFEPYLDRAIKRFPLLENASIRNLMNGPEAFTPDARMLIGPVPSRQGLLVAAGMNSNGIALSAGVGRLVAEWIVDGYPSIDVSRFDVRRFTSLQARRSFMRERVTEIVSYCVEMHDVDADCASARNIRTSPLHALLDERCAQFQSIVAWERPAYFGDTRKLSFSEIVQNEIANSMTKHLCIDRSTDCKIELSGSGTMQAWHKLAPGVSLPPPWRPKTFPIINSFGGVDAIVTVLQCSTNKLLLLANPEQETYLRDLLSRRLAKAGQFEITDVTNRYALLRLIGPDAPVWIDLAQSIDPDSAVPVAVGEPTDFDRSMCCRAWDDDWSSTKFLLLSSESAPDFVRQLEAAAQRSFHWGGFFAEESFRIRNAIPAFGAELVPYAQVRLGDFSCLAGFVGDAANTGAPHRSVFGEIACPLAPGIHDSPVFAGAEVVGRLTSATAVSIAASRVMARIRSGNFDSVLSVVLGGTEWEIQRMPHCENQ